MILITGNQNDGITPDTLIFENNQIGVDLVTNLPRGFGHGRLF